MPSVEPNTIVEVAVIALLVAALTKLQCHFRLLQYLFFLRLPLVHALILLLLPLAVWTRAFGNLFVVTPLQLTAITVLLLFSTWAVTYAWGLVFVGAAPRFRLKFRQPDFLQVEDWDRNPLPNKVNALLASERKRAYIVPLILGTPVLVCCVRHSTEPPWKEALAIAGGVALAVGSRELSLWAGHRFRRWLYTSRTSVPATRFLDLRRRIHQAAYRIGETRIGRALGPAFSSGYSTLSSDDPTTTSTPLEESENAFSHWRAVCFVALALVVYVAGAFLLDPSQKNPFVEHTPALAYILLVVTVLGLVLPATTFFLDFYRIPLVVLLAVALFVSYKFSDLDHYYDFSSDERATATSLEPLTAPQVVKTWSDKHQASTHPVMVVITASGGGSHAARWTTEVLSRLRSDTRLGAKFFESTSFVSAVSGGALGAMYALEAYNDGPPDPRELERARRAASSSNVGALAWGLIYPDLVRKIVPWLFDARRDRGWALEQTWRSELANPSATLASWDNDVRAGTKPAVVFNATIMETGKRLLISRVLIPETGAHQFATLYPDRDLSVVTAVRLSAAFAYLSPIARPFSPYKPGDAKFDEFESSAYHVADGGYYDGSGTLTAVEFLKIALPVYRKLGRTKILLVQIRTAEEREERPAGHKNWLAGLAGPLSTAFKVATSSQTSRATLELELLADRWNNSDLPEAARVEIKPVVFRFRGTGTLPWHLSEAEKTSISEEWMTRDNQQALTQLVDFFGVSP